MLQVMRTSRLFWSSVFATYLQKKLNSLIHSYPQVTCMRFIHNFFKLDQSFKMSEDVILAVQTYIKPHKSLETNPVSWILVLTFGLSSICMLIDQHQGHSRRLELIGGIRSEFLVGFQLHANHIGASRIFLSSHLFEWTAHIVSFFSTCESEKLLLFLSCIWKHETCNFQQLTRIVVRPCSGTSSRKSCKLLDH
jgi:hypothetical protein